MRALGVKIILGAIHTHFYSHKHTFKLTRMLRRQRDGHGSTETEVGRAESVCTATSSDSFLQNIRSMN